MAFEAALPLTSIIPYFIGFIVLFIGSYTDFKTREVPDWVNFGLIGIGFGINLLFSAIYWKINFILASIAGFGIFFALAWLMFYFGQWGGGDSKMLMGLGAMIGIDIGFKAPQFLLGFFINALFVGAVYGLLWSVLLVFKHKEKFWKESANMLSRKGVVAAKKMMLILLVLFFSMIFLIKPAYLKILIMSMAFLVLVTFYLWIFVKAVEKSAMHKLVEPSKLTEGDWIVKDVYVGKEYICGPKDLGIDKKQIRKLIEFYKQKKVKKILIKEGIPFVPSFFIAFFVTFVFGNPLFWLF